MLPHVVSRQSRDTTSERIRLGFTLVEVVVAIAVVAILAGALSPLVMRAVQQQREERTRQALRSAFEALYGARDRRVANCRADFGFDPGAGLGNLGILVSRTGTPWAAVPTYGNGPTFLWGYNGPYWSGQVTSAGLPGDGWGRALSLASNGQVVSAGADGLLGTADDLRHPSVAPSRLAYSATVTLVLGRVGLDCTGTATLQFPYGMNPPALDRCIPPLAAAPAVGSLAALPQAIANVSTQSLTWNVPAGTVHLTLAPGGTGSFKPLAFTLDLLPGETRQLQLGL